MSDSEDGTAVVRFPQSRVPPAGHKGEFTDLGLSPLAGDLGMTRDRLHGHWCSRCRGIWFGYLLEVECPCCGNRHG